MDINTDFSCIIATHDLPLTDMAETYPENVSNLCFELDEKWRAYFRLQTKTWRYPNHECIKVNEGL